MPLSAPLLGLFPPTVTFDPPKASDDLPDLERRKLDRGHVGSRQWTDHPEGPDERLGVTFRFLAVRAALVVDQDHYVLDLERRLVGEIHVRLEQRFRARIEQLAYDPLAVAKAGVGGFQRPKQSGLKTHEALSLATRVGPPSIR